MSDFDFLFLQMTLAFCFFLWCVLLYMAFLLDKMQSRIVFMEGKCKKIDTNDNSVEALTLSIQEANLSIKRLREIIQDVSLREQRADLNLDIRIRVLEENFSDLEKTIDNMRNSMLESYQP